MGFGCWFEKKETGYGVGDGYEMHGWERGGGGWCMCFSTIPNFRALGRHVFRKSGELPSVKRKRSCRSIIYHGASRRLDSQARHALFQCGNFDRWA